MKRTLMRSLQAFIITIVLMTTIVVQPGIAATQVNYGESYYIQNQESSSENYLSISPGLPGLECVPGFTKHNIFTDSVLEMKEETRSWKFVSTSGAEDGTPVSIGDMVYLQNQGPDVKSYLDACGLVDPASIDQVYVYTNEKPDWAGVGTGIWKIVSASGAEDGTPVSIDDLISLENQWTFDVDNVGQVQAYSFLRTCNPSSCDLKLEYGNSIIGDKDLPGTGAGVWKIKELVNKPIPVVNKPIPDQVTTVGQNYTYTIPAETFTDPDGDELALSATLEDGSPLPDWLTFDPSTNTFSGTPATGDLSTLTIQVSASDGVATASTTFTLTVNDICRVSAGELTADCVVTLPVDGEPVKVPVKIQTPADAYTQPLDLILLQDVSSSYQDDLPVLQRLVPDLVSEIQSLQPDTNFALSAFIDKPISPFGGVGDYVYYNLLKLTADSDDFQNAVNSLRPRGGGDGPEASLEALLQVAVRAQSELGARQSARSAVIVSTDDNYHKAGDGAQARIYTPNNGDAVLDGNGTGEDYPSVEQVKTAINNANLLPIFLVTRENLSYYNGLVSQLGVGAVVELEANSSNLIEALKDALEIVNQNLTIVVIDDEFGYVTDVDPDQFNDIEPGAEISTYVTFSYPGYGSDDSVTIRALGLGDLVIDVVVNLTDID